MSEGGRTIGGLLVGTIVVALAVGGSALVRSSFGGEGGKGLPILGQVRDFALVERSGRELTGSDLRGRVWVADFIFTRCVGPCPMMTTRMALLQEEIDPEVGLISFTVDPAYDTPEVLSRYADQYGADPIRWSFLTGDEEQIYRLAREGLQLTVEPEEESDQVNHSTRFVLIDREGQIRGYYSGADPSSLEDLERLKADASALLLEGNALIPLHLLPSVNAGLNGTSALLLVAGYLLIRRKKVSAHKACMLGAFGTSTLFLAFYIYYHFHHGGTPFPGQGWVRPVYFTILISHTVLAVALVPLVLITLYRAWRERFERHRAIARWTLPIWLYISVTGVIIYWMLYHLYGSS